MAKILYIEDTENNRILITRRLGQSGYKVLTAETAEQGMALARAERPDLILMDMGLPEVDGWSATRRLKQDPDLKRIPVIALTAHVMHGDREKALAAGCDDYDTKPFQFVRLLNKIANLLGNTAPASRPADGVGTSNKNGGSAELASIPSLKDRADQARHDLCNPLSNILGFCEILFQTDQPVRGEEVRSAIRAIERSASQMVKLLKQTLNSAQPVPSFDEIQALKAQLHEQASNILMRNKLLIEQSAANRDERLREDLSRMLESSERVAGLIDTALNWN